jgi:hypothetical protein
VLVWKQGDTVPLGRDRTRRVLGVRDDYADQAPVLAVEDMPGAASSAAGLSCPSFGEGRAGGSAMAFDRRPAQLLPMRLLR